MSMLAGSCQEISNCAKTRLSGMTLNTSVLESSECVDSIILTVRYSTLINTFQAVKYYILSDTDFQFT